MFFLEHKIHTNIAKNLNHILNVKLLTRACFLRLKVIKNIEEKIMVNECEKCGL